MGECTSPKSRLLSYICAVADVGRTGNTGECAIHRHFAEDHVLSDLSLCLVETLPPTLRQKPSMIPAFRKDAKLNTQRFLHHSFSGDSAARWRRRVNKKTCLEHIHSVFYVDAEQPVEHCAPEIIFLAFPTGFGCIPCQFVCVPPLFVSCFLLCVLPG